MMFRAFRQFALTACVALASFATFDARAETIRPHAVAELFTSQGCSSCPPADKLWNELAKRDDVLALMLPVDYWDYLGWKDTLARPAHTNRQRAYARSLRARSIYTPQGVVNGHIDVVGSRRGQVLQAIESGSGPLDAVLLDIEASDTHLTITASPGESGAEAGGTLWLIAYQPEETVAIGRGENTGRTITYTNIVRKMKKLGKWRGMPVSFTVRRAMAGPGMRCAVIYQRETDGYPGPIEAAAVLRETL